jgi:AraC-like DNA-binding protein
MNLKIVKIVVEYIELNYHVGITNDIIEQITGKSAGYVRNEFKKIVDLSLDEYRIKRELTLIINEIKEKKQKLSDSNLLPWATTSSFCDVFKKTYGQSPMQFVKKFNQHKLQPMFDIETYELSYNNDVKIIETLIRSKGNKRDALRYILSLRPYFISGINSLFITEENILDILIKYRYQQEIRDKSYAGLVPNDFIRQHKMILEKYYDLSIKVSYFDNSQLFSDGYICVKASILKRLLYDDEFDNIINAELVPVNLTTIWYDQIKMDKLGDNIVAMPNELIDGKYFTNEEWAILHELVMQEEGHKRYNSIEELRNALVDDYSFAIDRISTVEVIEVIKELIISGVIFLSHEVLN